jgi:hypothetical protein
VNLVLTQEGALLLWKYLLGITVAAAPELHLLGSPFTPLHTSVYANFAAHELVVPGYSPVVLAAPPTPWAFLGIPQGQEAINQPAPWTFGGACTVYGWWLSDNLRAHALFGGAWTPPYTFTDLGGQFYVALQPSLISTP